MDPFIYQRRDGVASQYAGDLFISLDTVRTNAEQFGATQNEELHRIIIHGLLHLCGLRDKTSEERAEMQKAEDKALASALTPIRKKGKCMGEGRD